MKLLGLRVIVELDKTEEKSASGLTMTRTTDQSDFQKGVVVFVGNGKATEFGQYMKLENVKVGDRVIFQYGTVINLEGKSYLLVNESDVVAIY